MEELAFLGLAIRFQKLYRTTYISFLFFFLFFSFHIFQANHTPKMVATPVGAPIPTLNPIAILSYVCKPPEDGAPVSLGVTTAVDERSIEICELVVGLASVVLVARSWAVVLIVSFVAVAIIDPLSEFVLAAAAPSPATVIGTER